MEPLGGFSLSVPDGSNALSQLPDPVLDVVKHLRRGLNESGIGQHFLNEFSPLKIDAPKSAKQRAVWNAAYQGKDDQTGWISLSQLFYECLNFQPRIGVDESWSVNAGQEPRLLAGEVADFILS